MKPGLVLACCSLALQAALAAESRGLEDINSEITLSPKARARMATAVDDKGAARTQEVVKTKRLEVSGPMVKPFKAKTAWNFPGRVLHLVNPFAKGEAKEPAVVARGVSPRAWAAAVGWRVSASTFPDAVDHEPSMGLVSVGRRQP